MSSVLSIADLLSAPDLRPGKVDASEIRQGSHLFIAQIDADERDLLESQWVSVQKARGTLVGFRAFVVAWCLCDERNRRTLTPGSDPDTVKAEFLDACEKIGAQHSAVIARAFDLACAKNGLTKADVDAMEKNCEPTTADDGSGDKL